MTDNVAGEVRDFIEDHVTAHALNDDDDIFEMGLVNSMFVIQLVRFIEDTFSVRVEADDLQIPRLCSINRITDLVERYQSAAPAAGS